MYTETKKIPIYAGLKQSRINKIGYKIVRFIYDSAMKDHLIYEIEVKRVIK